MDYYIAIVKNKLALFISSKLVQQEEFPQVTL
jgi:hypothetical protein